VGAAVAWLATEAGTDAASLAGPLGAATAADAGTAGAEAGVTVDAATPAAAAACAASAVFSGGAADAPRSGWLAAPTDGRDADGEAVVALGLAAVASTPADGGVGAARVADSLAGLSCGGTSAWLGASAAALDGLFSGP